MFDENYVHYPLVIETLIEINVFKVHNRYDWMKIL